MTKILAIITVYHPESKLVENLIKNSLAYAGCDVFLSDNAEFNAEFLNNPRIIYHNNHGNVGLGAAQNKGLTLALEKNYDYAVLFDQDSQIENNFIANLIREFEVARQNDPKLIAAGPSFCDPRFTGKRAARYLKPYNTYKKIVIASGCIISVSLLKSVGLMDEQLFIDYVDTEWCYRAGSNGYTVMQLSQVAMNHTIGEVTKVWWGYTIQYQKPFRYYYLFRNSIIFIKKSYVPLKDKLYVLSINLRFLLKIPFLDHKWQRMKLVCKGLWDGLKS